MPNLDVIALRTAAGLLETAAAADDVLAAALGVVTAVRALPVRHRMKVAEMVGIAAGEAVREGLAKFDVGKDADGQAERVGKRQTAMLRHGFRKRRGEGVSGPSHANASSIVFVATLGGEPLSVTVNSAWKPLWRTTGEPNESTMAAPVPVASFTRTFSLARLT